MASTNNLKMIAGRETTAGTVVARSHVLPMRSISDLDTQVTQEVDPAIVGANMATGLYLMSKNSGGSVPLTPRPCPGYVDMINSLLGGSVTAQQVGGCLKFKYTGSEVSAKISASASGDTLTSEVGAKGSESGDTNFGTAGVVDLTGASYDTLAELVAYINGLSDYSAEKVMGDDDLDTASIIDITSKQGKDTWVYVWFSSAASGVYLYEFETVLTDTERPTLSIQYDGRVKNDVYSGCMVNSHSLSGSLQGMVEGDAAIIGFKEYTYVQTPGTTANTDATVTGVDTRVLIAGMQVTGTGIPADTTIDSITTIAEDGELELSANATAAGTVTLTFTVPDSSEDLEDVDPMIFYKGSTHIGGAEYTYISSFSLDVTNNGKEDGYGQGSVERLYHNKGEFAATGQVQLRLDATSHAERAKVYSGDQLAIDMAFEGQDLGSSLKEFALIEMPYCQLTNAPRIDNGGQLDIQLDFQAINPKGTNYNSPFKMSFVLNEDIS